MSVFDTAKQLPTTGQNAKGKAKKRDVIPVEGFRNYVMADAVVKGFTALLGVFGGNTKTDIANTFKGVGKQLKARPKNFDGYEGEDAEGSCQLRIRDSRSPLTADEAKMLADLDVPVGEKVIREEGYFVNPAHYDLLAKMKGLPADFLLYQAKETLPIVTDDTIDAVFEKGLADKLLDMVAVIAIRGQYKGTLKQALAEMAKYADMAEQVQKAEDEAKKEAAKASREAKKAGKGK